MSRGRRLFFVAAMIFGGIVRADTIDVSAAVSLKGPLTDIGAMFESATNEQVRFNFDGSGRLAAQIRQGAPVDVFVAADGESMDSVASAGLAGERTAVARNRLVLVVPKGAAAVGFGDLPKVRGKIAVGDPATVPAGRYAAEVFRSLGIDGQLGGHLVYGQNVREALTLVARREADCGIVYQTDAATADVTVAAKADETWHGSIVYPAAVIRTSPHAAAAKRFVEFLSSRQSRRVLADHGFELPGALVDERRSAQSTTVDLGRSTILSIGIATVASIVAVVAALGASLVRRQFFGRRVAEAALMLPLVLPPTVVGYGLIVLLGRHGLAGYVATGYSMLFRPEGGIVAAAVVAFPLAYLPIKAALSAVSRDLEDVARLMGAGRWQVFWHVSLPLARRGIAAGCLLAFGRAIGEFGATTMVMGTSPDRQTLPVAIYSRTMTDDLQSAAGPVAALAAISLGVVLLSDRFGGVRKD